MFLKNSKLKTVLVECENEKRGIGEVYSASGIMFFDDYILITANLILWATECSIIDAFSKTVSPGKLHLQILPELRSLKFRVLSKKTEKLNSVLDDLPAKIVATFKCDSISKSVDRILNKWTINSEEHSDKYKNCMSLFFVLSANCSLNESELLQKLPQDLYKMRMDIISKEQMQVGQDVFIRSCPFGNRHFINSHSQGVISNILGENSCFLFSDCPTVSGSEGSPIFCNNRHKVLLVGIVISSLTWWNGEWTGLTLGVNINTLLRELLPKTDTFLHTNPTCIESIAQVEKSLVQIVCGELCGTGMLISKEKGIFITNSHVVQQHSTVLLYWRNSSFRAITIYRTASSDGFDLAVLKCNKHDVRNMQEICVTLKPTMKGDVVYSAGYGLFCTPSDARVNIAKGVISNSNEFMIMTTCSVHPGASGGAIMSPRGKLVGVIVCNTKLFESNATFPRINMAIPVTAIFRIIQEFLINEDVQVLKKLCHSNPDVKRWWSLQAKL